MTQRKQPLLARPENGQVDQDSDEDEYWSGLANDIEDDYWNDETLATPSTPANSQQPNNNCETFTVSLSMPAIVLQFSQVALTVTAGQNSNTAVNQSASSVVAESLQHPISTIPPTTPTPSTPTVSNVRASRGRNIPPSPSTPRINQTLPVPNINPATPMGTTSLFRGTVATMPDPVYPRPGAGHVYTGHATRFYVIFKGLKLGIFDVNWFDLQPYVRSREGGSYRKANTFAEALALWENSDFEKALIT
ncbi:hypothetical protein HWV62_45314 [Athelia sp. TMB]|nr:hypothetical protein HWV62_45314 [Athelia sp. TMB]